MCGGRCRDGKRYSPFDLDEVHVYSRVDPLRRRRNMRRAAVLPMECPAPEECYDPRHFEYRTWPLSLPAPRSFRRGAWPHTGTRADRVWARLRGAGVIRLYHV